MCKGLPREITCLGAVPPAGTNPLSTTAVILMRFRFPPIFLPSYMANIQRGQPRICPVGKAYLNIQFKGHVQQKSL